MRARLKLFNGFALQTREADRSATEPMPTDLLGHLPPGCNPTCQPNALVLQSEPRQSARGELHSSVLGRAEQPGAATHSPVLVIACSHRSIPRARQGPHERGIFLYRAKERQKQEMWWQRWVGSDLSILPTPTQALSSLTHPAVGFGPQTTLPSYQWD